MTSNSIKKFVEMKKITYSSLPYSGEHESMNHFSHKKAYGLLAIRTLKEVAKEAGATAVGIRHNWSGDIDRGFVGGFFERNGKYVYVDISDAAFEQPILFRTARHDKDYTGGTNNFAEVSEDGFEKLLRFVVRNTEK